MDFLATLLVCFLAALFLADLLGVAAFCGETAPATTAATGAAAFLVLLAPALLIFFDPAAFFVLLAPVALFATFPLAITMIKNQFMFRHATLHTQVPLWNYLCNYYSVVVAMVLLHQ